MRTFTNTMFCALAKMLASFYYNVDSFFLYDAGLSIHYNRLMAVLNSNIPTYHAT